MYCLSGGYCLAVQFYNSQLSIASHESLIFYLITDWEEGSPPSLAHESTELKKMSICVDTLFLLLLLLLSFALDVPGML